MGRAAIYNRPIFKNLKSEEIRAHLEEPAADHPKTPTSEVVRRFRKEFSDLLRNEAKVEQLVVLIDDLNRYLPATAIETLEAIRLFLFVPNHVVISTDEGMVEYAVRQALPRTCPRATGSVPYARNYLKSFIRVPFRIPALGTQETRIYVLLLLIETIVGADHAANCRHCWRRPRRR